MRLIELRISGYRVLHDLEIVFRGDTQEPEDDYTLTFLVGVNGSGKSTVFKALVEIMSKLSRNQTIAFPFRLEYVLDGENKLHIVVDQYTNDLEIIVNGQSRKGIFDESLLPRRIVIFTTGNESDWEELRNVSALRVARSNDISTKAEDVLGELGLTSAELVIQELPGHPIVVEGQTYTNDQQAEGRNDNKNTIEADISPENVLLFIKASQIPLLTLCGLLADLASDEGLLGEVLKEAQIRTLRGFSLKFRMYDGVTEQHDRDYIELLRTKATRALHMGTDYLLMFDLTRREYLLANNILDLATKDVENIASSARGLRFFERLAHLAEALDNTPPVLREVNLFFERSTREVLHKTDQKDSPILLFDWLSDGERSFLGRMCLFSLLGGTESLILLDEPEVHFNDFWKRQIVFLIDKVLQGHPSHALITTHSSITLTDAKSKDIVVLNRDGTFTTEAFSPGIRTYGADPSDIIVNVFGAPQATGARSVEDIKDALRYNPEDRSEPRRQRRIEELKQLLEQVGPGYWSYQLRRRLEQLQRNSQSQ